MENEMETTIVYWGSIGIMENPINPKPETLNYYIMYLDEAGRRDGGR